MIGLDEAHAAYYLRFPMKRLDDGKIPDNVHDLIGLAPQSLIESLKQSGTVDVITTSQRGGRSEHDADQLVLLRWKHL